jgi:formate/nitrite transporter FocA (FNT family)
VSAAPTPAEIFDRAAEEGRRRLDQSLLELLSTSFIAGFTVVFGLAALGIVHALVPERFGGLADILGALAFAPSLVFLVVGRTELFNENFADPIAAAAEADSWLVPSLLRLWSITLVLNLVGGVLFAVVVSTEGALPPGTGDALAAVGEEFTHRQPRTVFSNAIVGGALVSLLSFLLQASDSVGSRISLSLMVGFLLALGPFDHVIVTVLHIVLGVLFGAEVSYRTLAEIFVVATAGNAVGGIGLVTFTHVIQAEGFSG